MQSPAVKTPLITNANAVRASYFLLALDQDAIAETFRLDAQHWIEGLTTALERYEHHTELNALPTVNGLHTNARDQSIEALTHRALNLVSILTPDAKETLADFLKQPQLRLKVS